MLATHPKWGFNQEQPARLFSQAHGPAHLYIMNDYLLEYMCIVPIVGI